MLFTANLQIHRFGLPAVKEYFSKYTMQTLPLVNTIRNQQTKIYNNVLQNI